MYKNDGSLYPIPIRILNYRQNSNLVNQNTDPFDFINNQLFTRFLLFDSLSGLKTTGLNVLRVPIAISFWISKSSSDVGKIQVPIFDILYSEREVNGLSATDGSFYSSPKVIFSFLIHKIYLYVYSIFYMYILI